MPGYLMVKADARRIPLPDKSVDLVIGSPPYLDARTYLEDGKDLGIARKCQAWIDWMLGVTEEALRVSRGLVIWVCAGKTEDWTYQPGPEGLAYEWWKRGGSAFRPCYWHRSGIMGSGGKYWYRADIEYVLAFKAAGPPVYGDPKANGHKPKYKPGGAASYRERDGKRVNKRTWKLDQVNHSDQDYIDPDIANPGNLVHTVNGGGNLGSGLAHDNEAPFSIEVPRFFINSHCPPGGLVLDPFSGSGTTADAALQLGRNAIGLDMRMSQCRLGRKRLRSVTPGFAFAEEGAACET